jgi:NitT/TauT family transport system ATP-binding protein
MVSVADAPDRRDEAVEYGNPPHLNGLPQREITQLGGRIETLHLSGVSFAYPDGTRVFEKIDLSVAEGDIVGIVGPSGCGKSTLLALIAGLLESENGTIQRGLADGSHERHPLAMVFQTDTLLPWLTVRENVKLYSRFSTHGLPNSSMLRRMSKRLKLVRGNAETEFDRRIDSLLHLVGLADKAANNYPYQLSGGMRRRAAFVSAVASQPQILLLDEPFSAVDEPSRLAIHQDIYRIIRMSKITTLLVTHDLAEAITLADRIIIMGKSPAGIVDQHDIEFGMERDMLELRAGQAYLQIYGKLWFRLSEEIRSANPATGWVAS